MPPFFVPALCVAGLGFVLLLALKALVHHALPPGRNITAAVVAFLVQCTGLWLGVLVEDHFPIFLTMWLGKVISLCGVVIFIRIFCSSFSWPEFGICRPNPKGVAVTACLIVLFMTSSWLINRDGLHRQMFSLNTFFYMLTIAGLDEELVFRGIMPSLLLARGNSSVLVTKINRIVSLAVPTLMFSLMHAWRFSSGHFTFSASVLGIVGTGACALMYLRVHTGSLLNSVVLHNALNAGTVLVLAMA